MSDDRNELELASSAIAALGDRATDEKLDLLMLAWLMVAAQARNEQLPFPDGFPTEKQRQIQQLENAAELVRTVEPEMEAERLYLEDPDEWARYVVGQFQPPPDDDSEKGGA